MLLALVLVAAGAGCSTTTAEPSSGGQTTQRDADGRLDLAGVCPDPVVVQSGWHLQHDSGAFVPAQLLGEGWKPDAERKRVTGPLVAHGVDTGVDIEIRAGGPAVGFQPTAALMYTDETITLGMVATDQIVQFSAGQPITAVLSTFEIDPQVLLWWPAAHPDWNVIADIGQTDEKVLYFEGNTYMSYLIGSGILRESQVDGSFNGSPDQFMASGGTIAAQGYATNEPYLWANEVDAWQQIAAGKDPALESAYIYDTGYENYAEAVAVRAGDKDELAPCLERLVPIMQQAQVDFMADPEPTSELILAVQEDTQAAVIDSPARSAHAVEVMTNDGLVSNGHNDVIGDFDMERLQGLMDIVGPIFAGQNTPVAEGLTPEDIATNEFIDESIGLTPAAS